MFPHLVSPLFKGMKRDKEKDFKIRWEMDESQSQRILSANRLKNKGKKMQKIVVAVWVCNTHWSNFKFTYIWSYIYSTEPFQNYPKSLRRRQCFLAWKHKVWPLGRDSRSRHQRISWAHGIFFFLPQKILMLLYLYCD